MYTKGYSCDTHWLIAAKRPSQTSFPNRLRIYAKETGIKTGEQPKETFL